MGALTIEQQRALALARARQRAQSAPSSTLGDVAKSFGSGVVRGATETAMLPVTAGRLLEQGGDYLFNKGDNLIRSIIGADPLTDEDIAQRAQTIAQSPGGQMDEVLFGAQDAARGARDSVLHTPETTAGEYANTIGEFVAPGALPSRAVRALPGGIAKAAGYGSDVVGNIVGPAVVSETAGQMTEGGPYEEVARILGAVGGNVGTAGLRAYNAPEMAVRRATSDMTDQQWQAARDLQDNSFGVKLTGPEAVAQATEGGNSLTNLQRVVEGSVPGNRQMAPFFAQRPEQVDQALRDFLDQIAPQSAQPSVLGPRAATAAGGVIDNTRRDINATTRPAYDAAAQQIVDPPGPLPAPLPAELQDPRFQQALERLRGNAEMGPDYAAMPDNSVGVIDAVTKDMFSRGEMMSNRANPLYGPEQGMRNTQAATNARDLARDPARGGSVDYDAALQQQEQLRHDVLQPVQEGPVGRVAASTDTAGASNAILPQNPLVGSGQEAGDATAALLAEDPDTIMALIRQALGDRYSRASTATQEGSREFAGAKFAKDIAGNPSREEVLNAVLAAVPGSSASASLPELLDVLQATGRRKPIGSATSFNTAEMENLGTASPLVQLFKTAKTAGTSFITQAGDAGRRATLRSNLGALAELFTDPQSVDLLKNAVNRSVPINLIDAARSSLIEGATIGNRQ